VAGCSHGKSDNCMRSNYPLTQATGSCIMMAPLTIVNQQPLTRLQSSLQSTECTVGPVSLNHTSSTKASNQSSYTQHNTHQHTTVLWPLYRFLTGPHSQLGTGRFCQSNVLLPTHNFSRQLVQLD